MDALELTICPSCGSTEIKKVRRDWSGRFQDQSYTVPSLEFYECPVCGERVYDREAMRKIQEHSPAFARVHTHS
ncbi:MAG: YgiT-type zinc finger protein [Sedimentisphaerales bacterium]|nr:YgiT-type zinc finger protein [Sedimentisphaerales bacterium]